MRNVLIIIFTVAVLPLMAQSSAAVQAYNAAVQSYSQKDFKAVVGVLESTAQNEPSFVQAQRLMAEAYQQMGDESQTQYYYKRVMAAGGENADLWYRIGLSQKRSGDLDAAKSSFHQALALDPAYSKAQTKLAAMEGSNQPKPQPAVLRDADPTPAATSVAVSQPTRSPKSDNSKKITFYANKGVKYYNEEAFSEAATALEEAIVLSEGEPNSKLLCYAGRANLHLGKHDKALKFLEAAVAKDSDDGGYHYYLSQAYAQKGITNMADKHGKMASARGFAGTDENFNKMATTHYNNGLDMYNAKNYMGAVQEFLRAIKENPSHAKYHYSLGLAHVKLDRTREAESAFQQAIALDPSFDMAFTQMGHLLFAKGEYKKAGSYYEEAINQGPKTYNAYLNVAYCYDKLENHKKALPFYEEAERLNPDHLEVRFACAMSHFKAKSYPEAKKRFANLVADVPGNARILQNTSTLFGITGDFEKGLEYAMLWIKAAPESGEAYNQAGDMLINLDRKDEGYKYKRKAKQLGCDLDTKFY